MNLLDNNLKLFAPKNIKELIYIIIVFSVLSSLTLLGFYFFYINFFPEITIDRWFPLLGAVFVFAILILMFLIMPLFFIGYYFKSAFSKQHDNIKNETQKITRWFIRIFVIYFIIEGVVLYITNYSAICLILAITAWPYFYLITFILRKKSEITLFKTKTIHYIALNFFIIYFWTILGAIASIKLSIFYPEMIYAAIPVFQIAFLISGIAMVSPEKISRRNFFGGIFLLLITFFISGILGNIVPTVMKKFNIRKEHVNVILSRQSCIQAANLLRCDNPSIPQQCTLYDILAPSTIGSTHLIYIPVKQFSKLVHCAVPSNQPITKNTVLKFELQKNQIHYGKLMENI